ncbi:Amino acid transporter [Aphelenchoides avenae]|nr:Amino acid transporter [Aphelenchus avenae]
MSHMFLGKAGIVFTYLALSLYLFGDLAIYSTTVPKSLMNVICATVNASAHPNTTSCYEHWPEALSRHNVYLLCVVAFLCTCLPMVYIGMTKTKLLQLATTVARWMAFSLMIIMATVQLIQNGPQASPPAANFGGFGSLFGVAVYAFMCHHSLPGLITPMEKKSHVSHKLTFVYAGIFLFYCTLSITGSFTFSHVQDVYTLNFLHDDQRSFFYAISDYFLALFPVFTLTSSYIIVAISLSNNVKVLLSMIKGTVQRGRAESNRIESEALLADDNSEEDSVNPSGRATDARSHGAPSTAASRAADIAIPLVVVLLPATISFSTDNVLLLASITGSYPGVGVQFVIPSVLAIFSRKFARKMIDEDVPAANRSPFHQWYWPYVTLSWAAIAVIVVTVNVFHLG